MRKKTPSRGRRALAPEDLDIYEPIEKENAANLKQMEDLEVVRNAEKSQEESKIQEEEQMGDAQNFDWTSGEKEATTDARLASQKIIDDLLVKYTTYADWNMAK